MPIFPKSFGQTLLTTDWVETYSSPVLGRSIVKSIFMCNVSVAEALVDVAILRAGETVPADKNMIFTQKSIAAMSSDLVNEVMVLEPGDKIFAKSSYPTSFLVSGVLVTDVSYFTKHADLQNLLGTGPEFYHLSETQWQAIVAATNPGPTNRFITREDMVNPNWKIIDTNDYVAEAWDALFIDTSSGPIRVYLPPEPTLGTNVKFADAAGTFEAFPMTIMANGKRIMGIDEDMTVYTSNQCFSLTYVNDLNGWRLT